ncbi:hypothetical protein FRB90_000481 [Tulasnella sp. 427]|nr:hypothetical protein FRB90_000481 [Tulasnella sp. 427]
MASASPETNYTNQFFSPGNYVPFDSLDATFSAVDGTYTSDGFIEGKVVMEWGFIVSNNNHRFLLRETRGGSQGANASTVEVVFVSDALEKQKFIRKVMRVSLDGATLEWTGAKPKRRPKLTFADGIRLQKLDERGAEVLETFDFRPRPKEVNPPAQDWLKTPAPESPPNKDTADSDKELEKKRKRSPTPEPPLSSLDFNDIRAEDNDTTMEMEIAIPEEDQHEELDVERAVSTHSGSSVSTNSEGRSTRTASVATSRPASPSPIPVTSSSKPPAEPPRKKARINSSGQKKVQPNHEAKSHGVVTEGRSGSTTSGLGSAGLNNEKNRKKRERKKAREKEKRELEMAQKVGAQTGENSKKPSPPPPPPLPRDPTLDLLAGYRCMEASRVLIPKENNINACIQRTPTDYHAIADLKKNIKRKVCFVGIVVAMDTPIRVGNQSDWSMGLSLVDSSFGEYSQPFLVNLYAKGDEGTRLPLIRVGQPLLLRQIMIMERPPGTLKGVGYKDSFQWVGYNPTTNSASYGDQPHTNTAALLGRWQATRADLVYFRKISAWWNAAGSDIMKGLGIPYSPTEPRNDPPLPTQEVLCTQQAEFGIVDIKDIPIQLDIPGHAVTVDLVVEVVRTWVHEYASNRVDIFVTDYSHHTRLKEDHQTPHLPYALKISAWDKVGAEAEVLTPGYYLFKSVPIKLDKEGFLEGKINDPRVNVIQKLSAKHEDLQDLLERKQMLIDGVAPGDSTELDPEELRQLDEDRPTTRLVLNQHASAPFSKIEDVLKTTTLPNKFRLAVQIVGHKPLLLRDWVRGYCNHCKKEIPKEFERCTKCDDSEGHHLRKFYRFAFKVRNRAGTEMVITASEEEAVSAPLINNAKRELDECPQQNFLKEIPCDYQNTKQDIIAFREYLKPILPPSTPPENGNEAGGGAPILDVCVAAVASEKYGRTYHLFGCQLMREEGDTIMKG